MVDFKLECAGCARRRKKLKQIWNIIRDRDVNYGLEAPIDDDTSAQLMEHLKANIDFTKLKDGEEVDVSHLFQKSDDGYIRPVNSSNKSGEIIDHSGEIDNSSEIIGALKDAGIHVKTA